MNPIIYKYKQTEIGPPKHLKGMNLTRSICNTLLIFLFLIGIHSYSFAADLVKVGSIDIKRIFDEYTYTKEAASQLQKELEDERAEIKGQEEQLIKDEDDLKRRISLLTEEEKDKQQNELARRKKELQDYATDVNRRIATKNDQLTRSIINDIVVVLKDLAVKEGYTMILERGSVLYASEDIDLTDKVIKILNQKQEESGE